MSYDFDYYSGRHMVYPIKPTKPTLGRNPSSLEARAWAEALEEYEREFKGYEENKLWYQTERARLEEELQDKLKKDYALSESEFSILWSEAYSRSHSGGLSEVYNEFDSLFDLVGRYILANYEKGSKD